MAWQFYTKGRRVPTLIGKDSAGRRIPGGPYTALQFLAMPGIPAALWYTRGLWAGSISIFGALAAAAVITFGGVKLLGVVDFAARNPLYVMHGYLKQTADIAPAGRCAGRKIATPTIRRIKSRINTATRHVANATPRTGEHPAQVESSVPEAKVVSAAEPDGEGHSATAVAPPPAAIQRPTGAVRLSGLEAFLDDRPSHPVTPVKESVR